MRLSFARKRAARSSAGRTGPGHGRLFENAKCPASGNPPGENAKPNGKGEYGAAWPSASSFSSPSAFALSPFRAFGQRERLATGALALAIGLAGWGPWLLRQRSRPVERAAIAAALDPGERGLREAVLRSPGDLQARRAVGQYLLARHRPYEAMWAYQDALDLRPGDPEARRGLAQALIMAQLPRRALETLTRGPTVSPPIQNPNAQRASKIQNEIEDRRIAAAAYLAMGDPMSAVTVLEALGPALETSPAALLDLGNGYEALGDDRSAARVYQQLVRLQPDHLEGELALARVAARHRSWTLAFAALARARAAAPADPRPLYQLALALQAQEGVHGKSGGLDEAISLYRRLLQSHPDFGPADFQLGLWYLRQGQPGIAASFLEQAVAARAGGDEARLRLADALAAAGNPAEAALQQGRYEEVIQEPRRAIREYERLAALAPGRGDVPLLLSAVYHQIEADEPAVQIARQGFERHPDDLAIRARYAMLLLMTDAQSQAVALCRRWMSDRPNWGEPYFLLGRMERDSLHPAEAAQLLDQALARDPHNADYCLESAAALIAQPTPAHLRQAAARLRQASALAPANAEAHLRLGETLERLGDLDGARLEYLRSMDNDRSVRFGVFALSQLCPRLQKPDRARFYAENVRVLRGREDAVKTLWRQVHRSPEDAVAHARLAGQLLDAGDTPQALYQLQQALRLRPDPEQARELQILRRLRAMREG